QERVEPLTNFPHEGAVAIELKQPRASVREQPRIAQSYGRIPGPGINEGLPFRVGRHAGYFAEIHVRRQLEHVRCCVEGDFRNCLLALAPGTENAATRDGKK